MSNGIPVEVDLVGAIVCRYAPPEWLVEPEVTLAGRRLDVVAFNLWGARQHRVVGFECKQDRGDWLRELGDFRKAEEWMRVVDDFYLVTTPTLVKPEELPYGWGHLELVGSRMMTRRYPAKREPGPQLPREVTARLLTRMQHRKIQQNTKEHFDLRQEIRAEIEEQIENRWKREVTNAREQADQAERERAQLLEALGIKGNKYGAQAVAMRAAGLLAQHEEKRIDPVKRLEHLATDAKLYADALDAALAQLRAMEAPGSPVLSPTQEG